MELSGTKNSKLEESQAQLGVEEDIHLQSISSSYHFTAINRKQGENGL